MPQHRYRRDRRHLDREHALNTDASGGDFSDHHRALSVIPFDCDDRSLELLDSLFLALPHLLGYSNGVTDGNGLIVEGYLQRHEGIVAEVPRSQ